MVVPGWTRASKCCFQPLSTCMDGAYTGIGTVGLIAFQGGIYAYGLGWLKRGGQRRDEKWCNYNDDISSLGGLDSPNSLIYFKNIGTAMAK